MEELDDLVDGECHVVGVLERVIGALDGDEFDDVVLDEVFCVLERDHLVFRAVQDQHIVGEVEVLVVEREKDLRSSKKAWSTFILRSKPTWISLPFASFVLSASGMRL